MSQKSIVKVIVSIFLCRLFLLDVQAQLPVSLESNFNSPPNWAKVQVWWHWMNGNVSKEGITLDLEAMKRIGVGGVHVFNVQTLGASIPTGSVEYGSKEWYSALTFAGKECLRLGMEMSVNNAPGWSCSGGPFISPDRSMQQLVWTETPVNDKSAKPVFLRQPYTKQGYYKDIAILAFPALEGDEQPIVEKLVDVISNSAGGTVEHYPMIDGDRSTFFVMQKPASGENSYLDFRYSKPQKLSAITIWPANKRHELAATLFISQDGKTFKKIGDFPSNIFRAVEPPSCLSFEPQTAKIFRIEFRNDIAVSEIEFHEAARISNYGLKSLFFDNSGMIDPELGRKIDESDIIDPDKIFDLTDKLDTYGYLNWDIPEGNWVILRIGHTSSGIMNIEAMSSGRGLEVDKMDKEAVAYCYDQTVGKIKQKMGNLAPALKNIVIDSWEVGTQNWSRNFSADFFRKNGYPIIKWLPALTGRVVKSSDDSERFLFDFRKTVAEVIAENYAGTMAKLAKKDGLTLSMESYGDGVFDDFSYGSFSSIPFGEFWIGQMGNSSCKLASSIAHVNGIRQDDGRQVVGSESFTSRLGWMESPESMKIIGDYAFTTGINRFVLHRYTHQPHPTASPGMTMGPWGVSFERTNTWFSQSGAWLDYLSRCQYLLQLGNSVCDFCFFAGMESPVKFHFPNQTFLNTIKGSDYDVFGEDVLLNKMSVKEGKFVVPDGTSYRVLVLPEKNYLSYKMLVKLNELVDAGGIICGPYPLISPGLADYSTNYEKALNLANRLWNGLDGKSHIKKKLGNGFVYWSDNFETIRKDMNLSPDFEFTSEDKDAQVNFIHRYWENTDVYFIANSQKKQENIVASFRQQKKVPEIWNPQTGEINIIPACKFEKDKIIVPLNLEPAESVFLIFRQKSFQKDAGISQIEKDGDVIFSNTLGFRNNKINVGGRIPNIDTERFDNIVKAKLFDNGKYNFLLEGKNIQFCISNINSPTMLNNKWNIEFQKRRGAPAKICMDQLISLHQNSNDSVKYFSGDAIYSKIFTFRKEQDLNYELDLGQVEVIATIKLNGFELGTLWKTPFRINITKYLINGINNLEIRVSNLFVNRLIGKAKSGSMDYIPENGGLFEFPKWYLRGEEIPGTEDFFVTAKAYKGTEVLVPSGLIGPVRIVPFVEKDFKIKK